mgnify:CR=1 FL=1
MKDINYDRKKIERKQELREAYDHLIIDANGWAAKKYKGKGGTWKNC